MNTRPANFKFKVNDLVVADHERCTVTKVLQRRVYLVTSSSGQQYTLPEAELQSVTEYESQDNGGDESDAYSSHTPNRYDRQDEW